MSEELRTLLYPLGVLPLFFFSGRFLVQWLMSEWEHRCVVPKLFWILSFAGHFLMMFHSGIQLQYHVGVTQACSGVIAWRNLNLMGPDEKKLKTSSTMLIFASIVFLVTLYFWMEGVWFRSPQLPGGFVTAELTWGWHLFGTLGLLLFSARFVVQWIQAEFLQKSVLSSTFWWISIVGNSMTLVYFFFLKDPINFIGPLFAMVPYIRNLVLIKRST
ncbi:MAG: lipid-A-disaccharide synthase N-terminal domain-containing protein [Parachlamydiales bacterium]|jgi:lipid-A-disaccharide synthase